MYATTETARMADVVLPAAGWGDKGGTFINSERRIGTIKKVARAPARRWPLRPDALRRGPTGWTDAVFDPYLEATLIQGLRRRAALRCLRRVNGAGRRGASQGRPSGGMLVYRPTIAFM